MSDCGARASLKQREAQFSKSDAFCMCGQAAMPLAIAASSATIVMVKESSAPSRAYMPRTYRMCVGGHQSREFAQLGRSHTFERTNRLYLVHVV